MADVFTDAGENLVADIITNPSAHPGAGAWYCAWGTGAGTASKSDTTLFTEASEARVATTDNQPSPNINRFVATMTADGSKTITNAGIFDASTAGELLLKSDFTGVALNLNDSIQFTFELTWS